MTNQASTLSVRHSSGLHDSDTGIMQLRQNDFAYRLLRDRLIRLNARNAPDLLDQVEKIANYAWWAHPGRFVDGAVENILLAAGRELQPGTRAASPRQSNAPSRTLHVATELYVTGGHSRVLAKWVERDLDSTHVIVLTRQNGPVPDYLATIADARAAPIIRLNPLNDIRERARQLRSQSSDADRVILHHHPDDAVPVLAYAQPGGCPVAMFNHAHFAFSLGSSIADVIINTMPYFRQITKDYRFPRATALLEGPLGLERLHWNNVDKRAAKERFGLPPEGPVALTVGAEAYFTPTGGSDFFATLARLLERRPDLHILVVGVPVTSPLVPVALRADTRLRFVGPVSDPRPYYEAADVCLESFPMPSLGALTEAVAYGEAFPVPAFAETENPLRVNQQRVSEIAVRQQTEATYLDYILGLLADRNVTRGLASALRRRLINDDACFGDQFQELYALIDRAAHMPRALPATQVAMTPENAVLASRTSRTRLREAIAHLPPLAAAAAHVHAVILGYEPLSAALLNSARDLARPLKRPLLQFRENERLTGLWARARGRG